MTTIIKNGRIVSADKVRLGDIKIQGDIIAEIGDINPSKGDRVVDAEGKFVLPGAVDVHTHLDLDVGSTSTADDFPSGTRAAIAGGTTTLIDFATQDKGGTLAQAVEVWQKKADKGAYCDYSFHMAIIDWNDNIKAEMLDMVKAGIPSFKMYMAYKGVLQLDDGAIYQALKRSVEIGGLIGFHCENGDLIAARVNELLSDGKTAPYYHPISRPAILEEEAIARLGSIAQLAEAPIWVVHLSTEKGLKVIRSLKAMGVEVVTETCPQYLLLDDSRYGSKDDSSFEGAKYVISPPLRKPSDIKQLWQGIQDGTIDFVSTDHCSFNFKGQKDIGRDNFSKIPNGGPGLESRLVLLYNFGVRENKITINQMVDQLSENPSRLLGLDNKGRLEVGKDADIVIFNPETKWVITADKQYQNLDYTPYEGIEITGQVEEVFLRGKHVFSGGEFTHTVPTGIFQKRSPYSGKKQTQIVYIRSN